MSNRARRATQLPLSRLLVCAPLLAALATSAGPAAAQADSALAEALFREGKALLEQKRYAKACPKLAESYRLEPKLGALLNLGVCYQSAGQHASAWASFTSAQSLARREGRADREAFAAEQVQALEKVLARLTLTAIPEGATVTLDGRPIERATIGIALPVDPGPHQLRATAPGKRDWAQVVEAPPTKAALTVAIPALADAPAAAPVAAALPSEPPAEPRDDGTYRVMMFAGFGVAAVGLAAGAVTGGLSLAKTGDVKAACTDNRCPADQSGAIDDATLLANVSNVSFAVAAVGAGVGLAGLLLRSSAKTDHEPGTALVVGPGAVGLRGRF
jgi:hypothetical protein